MTMIKNGKTADLLTYHSQYRAGTGILSDFKPHPGSMKNNIDFLKNANVPSNVDQLCQG